MRYINLRFTYLLLTYSMGCGLQLVEARFLNFSRSWWSHDFKVHEMLTSPEYTAFYLCTGRG